MGGYNQVDCLQTSCPAWTSDEGCENAMQTLSTLSPLEEGRTHQRVICGKVVGEVASRSSEDDFLAAIVDKTIPAIVDRIIDQR